MNLPCSLELAERDVATRDDVCRLREELATANANLAAFLEQRQTTAQRERDLRLALHEAHEQLIRRDEELVGALHECLRQQGQWQEQQAQWQQQRAQWHETARVSSEREQEILRLRAEHEACQAYLHKVSGDRDALLGRVQRFRGSSIGLLYRGCKRLYRGCKPLRLWGLRKLG
jgi:chromosome segregation ATPase